jgi:hypothetical protein
MMAAIPESGAWEPRAVIITAKFFCLPREQRGRGQGTTVGKAASHKLAN